MEFKKRTLLELGDMICGNVDNSKGEPQYFTYRSSYYISLFFEDADTPYRHNGSTRNSWVADTISEILKEPVSVPHTLPATFCRIIQLLMTKEDAVADLDPERKLALQKLNIALSREGYEAFYADDQRCYVRHVATATVANASHNPHRPFSKDELLKRERLLTYLERASEDDLTEEILLPLFRQLGFHRLTFAGHKDKALEYGKDLWMKYTLPTLHVLYFGIQVKKGKLDSAGVTRGSNANIAEVHNQTVMMLGHEIFDPEIGKKVLVDHAFIVAGGEITKAARNWLGGKLDASQRSQIMFIDRNDILNLFVVTNLPLPAKALPEEIINPSITDDLPF